MGAPGASYGPTVDKRKKVMATDILSRKQGEKIVSVTAYDYPTAKLVDSANIDIVLVGDSLGMVVLGYPDTTRVTMDDMVHHTAAVARARPKALVVADLPFLAAGVAVQDTIGNAGRLIREAGEESEYVVYDQHLAVADGPGTDTDRGDIQFAGNTRSEVGRNALEDYRKGSAFLDRNRIP